MFTFKRNHQFNHRWNLKTLRRIGEDLRKAGRLPVSDLLDWFYQMIILD
ncbi:hypothetical protein [Histophilus somni]|nr:hypothetical protein [Histophilus somni]